MSLADQIAERNQVSSSPDGEIDELGLTVPTPETPEYLVARALMFDSRDYREQNPWITGLHLRDGVIYKYHTVVPETKRSMLELTRLKRRTQEWEEVEFWRILKEYLPKLCRCILEVGPDLYWDIDKAELINREQAEERSKE